jgi:hypothetical protein
MHACMLDVLSVVWGVFIFIYLFIIDNHSFFVYVCIYGCVVYLCVYFVGWRWWGIGEVGVDVSIPMYIFVCICFFF